MNDLKSIENFRPASELSEMEIKKVLTELTSLEGITSLNVGPANVRVGFYPQLLSLDIIKDALVKAGFHFENSKKPGFMEKFILKLGQDNNEAFGGHPPDCCSDKKKIN